MWDIPWSQLVLWHQFYELSPWDKERDNLQSVIIGTAIINEIKSVRREFGSKSIKFIKADDLLLKFDRKRDGKQDGKQQKRDLGQQFHQMVREMKRDFVDGKDGGKGKLRKK